VTAYFLTLAVVLFAYMNLWFIVSLAKKRNDVADVAWGLGFVLLAWASFFLSPARGLRGLLVSGLVTVWGVRLAWHIYFRNKSKTEDYRYREWRAAWGEWFYVRSYLQVFMLQGLLLFLIAVPVLVINASGPVPLGVLDGLGLVVWAVGFFFESVGDRQLARFIKDPVNRGKLMTTGLWAYTRHPNYFGEVAQWWGIWLLALSAPLGLVALIGPLTITVLILKVSGIPLLEKKMAENPAFAEYAKRVSVFFPWLPKRSV